MFVNGVPVHGGTEGSYQGQLVWNKWPAPFTKLGVDLCAGHSLAGGLYHHHGYSACLAATLNDQGTRHSPVYAYSADGYAVYGPWHASNVRARSCWRARNYDNPAAPDGCGVAGSHICALNNPENVNGGVKPYFFGPSTSGTDTGEGDATVTTVSGLYVEDYGFDPTCPSAAPQNLDKFNGHDHDGLGYHYHLTVDAQMQPTFPGGPGPTSRGKLTGFCSQ